MRPSDRRSRSRVGVPIEGQVLRLFAIAILLSVPSLSFAATARRPVRIPAVEHFRTLHGSSAAVSLRDRFHPRPAVSMVRSHPEARPQAAPHPNLIQSIPYGSCGMWSELEPNTQPLGVQGQAMIYDPVRDRLVFFGGSQLNNDYTSDVWIASMSGTFHWQILATSGTPPPGLYGASAIYDAPRDRMIVFGGVLTTGAVSSDVFALNLSTAVWSQLATSGAPAARYVHTAIFDAPRNRMVVYGGYGDAGFFGDVWALDLAGSPVWTDITPSGAAPEGRAVHIAVFDAPRNRMVIFGGNALPDGNMVNDVWALALSGTPAWTPLAPTGTPPLPRTQHAALFDPAGNRMMLYGGFATDGTNYYEENDLWSLSMTNPKWTQLNPSGGMPPGTDSHAIAYDSARARLITLGGYGAAATDTWAVNLSGGPAWIQLIDPSQTPYPRTDHVAVYDGARHRAIMYGGTGSPAGTPLGDVWVFQTSGAPAWTKLVPTGAGPTLSTPAAVVDSARSRMIVFGGTDELLQYHNDAWALSLTGTAAWTQLNPSGTKPTPRTGSVAIYDPTRTRMVVFSGDDDTGQQGDVWALSLSGGGSWSQLNPSGDPPYLYGVIGAFDRPRDRMLVVGSNGSGNIEVWSLSFAGAGTWTQILADPNAYSMQSPGIVLDYARNRLLYFGYDIYAMPLTGIPTWSFVGTQSSIDLQNGARALFDQQNDRAALIAGQDPYTGQGTNLVRALSFPPNLYTVNVSATPEVAGYAYADPGYGCFQAGSTATFIAVPIQGFHLDSWSGSASGNANPLELTINGPTNVVANLAQPPPSCDGWRQVLTQSGALPLDYNVAAVYDSVRHRMLAVGPSNVDYTAFQIWALPQGSGDWTQLLTQGVPPGYRRIPQVAIDPVRDRLIVYGGAASDQSTILSDVWALSLAGTPTWTQLMAGSAAGPRWCGSLTYDPTGDRMIAFGGRSGYLINNNYLNDVWALSLAGSPSWSHLTPGGTAPLPRGCHFAVYDSMRHRLIVFGGHSWTANALNDVKALSLSGAPAWTSIAAGGVPPSPRGSGGAIYDPKRDRMLIYGGSALDASVNGYPGTAFDDVYTLSFRQGPYWFRLTPDGTMPGALFGIGSAYDTDNDRFMAVNGLNHNGAHALSLAGGYWLGVGTANSSRGSVTQNPPGDCFPESTVVTLTPVPNTGYHFEHWLGDVRTEDNPLYLTLRADTVLYAYFDPNTVGVDPDPLPIQFALDAAGPNPSASVSRLQLSLPRRAHVELRIFDLNGRLVRTVVRGELPAGRHRVEWTGDDATGSLVGAGVYFCRVRMGDFEATQRLVRIR